MNSKIKELILLGGIFWASMMGQSFSFQDACASNKNSDIYKTLLTAIIAGVVVGVVVFYIPKIFAKMIRNRRAILEYQFNKNETAMDRLRVFHSFGKAVQDRDASNGMAWQHTRTRLDGGIATCYGPYTKEIAFRGKYRAIFRVKAVGIKDYTGIILTLDVSYAEKREGGNMQLGVILKEKPITAKDLPDGKYKSFDVEFDYDGESFVEFRCIVVDPENYENRVDKIFFDNVRIFRVVDVLGL
jgi:hypothetical protein